MVLSARLVLTVRSDRAQPRVEGEAVGLIRAQRVQAAAVAVEQPEQQEQPEPPDKETLVVPE